MNRIVVNYRNTRKNNDCIFSKIEIVKEKRRILFYFLFLKNR